MRQLIADEGSDLTFTFVRAFVQGADRHPVTIVDSMVSDARQEIESADDRFSVE